MIELPDAEIESLHLTPEQARLELAVGLYAGREVTLGRAAKIAAENYLGFCANLITVSPEACASAIWSVSNDSRASAATSIAIAM